MNMMKKLFPILLVLALVCCSFSAAAEELASQLTGTWIETSGEGTLTVFADQTAVMYYNSGAVTETGWEITEDGARFTEGMWYHSPMELIDENTLSINNGWMLFAREGTEMEQHPLDLDAVPVGPEGEPYLGSWSLESMSFEDTVILASDFGMSMELIFQADGIAVSHEDGETNTSVWSVENGAAMVDGLVLTLNELDQLVMEDEGIRLIFVRSSAATEEAPQSEAEQLLALFELMSQLDTESTDLPEELQGYVGTWHMVYTATGGLTGDLRTMGVTCTLDLYSDGTGSIDFPSYEYSSWYDDEGIVRFGESGMPLTLLEDGFLQYGTEMGGYMIFSQDAEAVYTPAPAATEEPAAPAPAASDAAVSFASHEDYLNIRFVATTYSMMGQTYDASMLGAEYALLFRENGTCDFTMAGAPLPNLPWGLSQAAIGLTKVDAFAINYYGTMFHAIPTATGFDMDFYGTMTLHFVPAP